MKYQSTASKQSRKLLLYRVQIRFRAISNRAKGNSRFSKTYMHTKKWLSKWSHDAFYVLAENRTEVEKLAKDDFHKTKKPWKNKLSLEMEIIEMEVI